MKNKDLKKIIEDEIVWCEENRGMNSEVYENAFIAGLKQVLFFIDSLEPKLPKPVEIKQRKVFIVAENFNRARNWAYKHESFIPLCWNFVDSREKLRGLKDVVIYILDGWSHNPNYLEIAWAIEGMKSLGRAEVRYEQDLQKEQTRESVSG
jgi:hypothetical protein